MTTANDTSNLFSSPPYQSKKDNQTFTVCCYFTKNYTEHAMRLKDSLDKFNINYFIQPITDQGYWEANTRVKPVFLQYCLNTLNEQNILYVDADAIIKAKLDFFADTPCDIAVYHTNGVSGMSHDYLTGTIYLANNHKVHQFVEYWIDRQKNCKKTLVDQDSFDVAMQKYGNTLLVVPLDLGYVKIFDRNFDGKVYIEQYQASRDQTKLRRKLIRRRNKILLASLGVVVMVLTYFSLQ